MGDAQRKLERENAAMRRVILKTWKAIWGGDVEEAFMEALLANKLARANPDRGGRASGR